MSGHEYNHGGDAYRNGIARDTYTNSDKAAHDAWLAEWDEAEREHAQVGNVTQLKSAQLTHNDGIEAFHAGVTRDANPYPIDTPESHEWITGWDYAQQFGNNPKPLLDVDVYKTISNSDGRVTHAAFTQEQEQRMQELGHMPTPEPVEEKEPVPAERPAVYVNTPKDDTKDDGTTKFGGGAWRP